MFASFQNAAKSGESALAGWDGADLSVARQFVGAYEDLAQHISADDSVNDDELAHLLQTVTRGVGGLQRLMRLQKSLRQDDAGAHRKASILTARMRNATATLAQHAAERM